MMMHRVRRGGQRRLWAAMAAMLVAGTVLVNAPTALADSFVAEAVRTFETGVWDPPSGDPSGVVQVGENRLVIVDSEADENHKKCFARPYNMWEVSLDDPTVVHRKVKLPSIEPSGVGFDPVNELLFVSDDENSPPALKIWVLPYDDPTQVEGEINLRQILDEQDITIRDLEDPAYDPNSGALYALGVVTHPGPDDATPGITEDVIFRITASNPTFTSGVNVELRSISHLASDWFEGMAIDPNSGNLLVASQTGKHIYEVDWNDLSLSPINTIDASNTGLLKISGLGAVDVGGGETRYWVTDRRSDCDYPDDGLLQELTVGQVTNHQPSLQISPATEFEVLVGETVTFTAQASDDDDDELRISLDERPAEATITPTINNSAEVSWQVSGTPRVVRFLVRVEEVGNPQSFAVKLVTVNVKAASDPGDPGDPGDPSDPGVPGTPPPGGGGGGKNPPSGPSTPPQQPGTPGGGGGSKEPPSNPTGPFDFSDTNGHVFEADIEWLAAKGITRGCNPPKNDRFCPDDYVTRGQMAAFLVRALSYTDDGGGNKFVDDNGHVFEADLDRLATAGVTRGCNPPKNDRFCPDDYVTRGQMAAFLHRALGD